MNKWSGWIVLGVVLVAASGLAAAAAAQDEPIPRSAEKNEFAIYRNLLARSHLPRYLL
ncbi:MAG: hypothetical protein ACLFPD_10885 [Desulfosudaceae bacterium]